MNYYNEHDNFAADWLENLIEKGRIPNGKVDRRSIAEVQANDVRGFTQCHFFAGIGGWSLALRLAGWAPHRPVWTGSCPCQPFSQAGKQKAQKDERHLWPEMFRLIRECQPGIIVGEQVASAEVLGSQLEADFVIAIQGGEFARANKLARRLIASKSFNATPRWVDGIRSDLETANYSLRFRVLGAFSVNAPQKRARLFWVAESAGVSGSQYVDDSRKREAGREDHSADCCRSGGLADAVGNAIGSRPQGFARHGNDWDKSGRIDAIKNGSIAKAGAWSDYQIVHCLDGKSRRVGSSVQPLVNGIPRSLGRGEPELSRLATRARANYKRRLRGYGNAIVPQVAAKFVMAFMGCKSTNESEQCTD